MVCTTHSDITRKIFKEIRSDMHKVLNTSSTKCCVTIRGERGAQFPRCGNTAGGWIVPKMSQVLSSIQ